MWGPHSCLSSSLGPDYVTGSYLRTTLSPPKQLVAFISSLSSGAPCSDSPAGWVPSPKMWPAPSSTLLYLAPSLFQILHAPLGLTASHHHPCWPTVSPAYALSPSTCLYLKVQQGHFMEGLKRRCHGSSQRAGTPEGSSCAPLVPSHCVRGSETTPASLRLSPTALQMLGP